jgi:hypothetical protein
MLLCLGFLVVPARAATPKTEYGEILHSTILIEDNSIIATSNPNLMPNLTIFNASGTEDEEYPTTDLMRRIMICESGDDPTAQNPNSTAYGRCQMLKSTQEYVELKWKMDIDFLDPEQQLYACNRLLAEETWTHWTETKFCWDPNNEY